MCPHKKIKKKEKGTCTRLEVNIGPWNVDSYVTSVSKSLKMITLALFTCQ